jgi:hypothetical protein
MGSAMAEEMDNELERGEMQVLDTTEAEDARDALEKSISFLEKARELVSSDATDVLIPRTKFEVSCTAVTANSSLSS